MNRIVQKLQHSIKRLINSILQEDRIEKYNTRLKSCKQFHNELMKCTQTLQCLEHYQHVIRNSINPLYGKLFEVFKPLKSNIRLPTLGTLPSIVCGITLLKWAARC